MKRRHLSTWTLVPLSAYLLCFGAFPVVKALYISLTNADASQTHTAFIGLSHYSNLTHDAVFKDAYLQTVRYFTLSTGLKAILGLLIGYAICGAPHGRQALTSVLLLPLALPPTLMAIVWRWMFYDVGGIVNYMLVAIGALSTPIHWIGRPDLALLVAVIAQVWRGTPLFILAVILGVRTIPHELREAAAIDGANRWVFWRSVILPIIAPLLLSTVLISIIFDIGEFELIALVTGGGPGDSTDTLTTYAFEIAIKGTDQALGHAIMISALPLVLMATYLATRASRFLDKDTVRYS